jgi:opacity protein-like surface antigen
MKMIPSIVVVAILISAFGARAQLDDFEKNMYVTYAAGAVFQQDVNVRQSTGNDARVSFNPGARADIGLGYNFNNWFSANVSGGFIWNTINDFGGVPLSTLGQSVNIYSIPILTGITLKLPNRTHFIPFVGLAVGANISEFYLDSNGVKSNDHDVEPAFQAEAGLNYAINPDVSLGLDYKFMTTAAQRYDLSGDNVSQSGIYIHGIFIDLSMSF